MTKVNIFITEAQHERLREEKKRTGLRISDLVRRAIDQAYPESPKQEEKKQ